MTRTKPPAPAPTPPDTEAIEWLARRCAARGLRWRDAMTLFDALYIADALAIEGGNVSAAAIRAGIERKTLYRHRTEP